MSVDAGPRGGLLRHDSLFEAGTALLRSNAWPIDARTNAGSARVTAAGDAARPIVFLIDDESAVCQALIAALEEDGLIVRSYETCEAFLDAYRPGRDACILFDAGMLGTKGLELIDRLNQLGYRLPVITMMGDNDASVVVKAMKAGVSEFVEKPVSTAELLAGVHRVIEREQDANKLLVWRQAAALRIAALTPRQRQVLLMILDGAPNKNIAADLQVSQRTVESHRASIMRKTGSRSLPELARLAVAALYGDADPEVYG
jgi:two-component system CheB/CheR fusion protein